MSELADKAAFGRRWEVRAFVGVEAHEFQGCRKMPQQWLKNLAERAKDIWSAAKRLQEVNGMLVVFKEAIVA